MQFKRYKGEALIEILVSFSIFIIVLAAILDIFIFLNKRNDDLLLKEREVKTVLNFFDQLTYELKSSQFNTFVKNDPTSTCPKYNSTVDISNNGQKISFVFNNQCVSYYLETTGDNAGIIFKRIRDVNNVNNLFTESLSPYTLRIIQLSFTKNEKNNLSVTVSLKIKKREEDDTSALAFQTTIENLRALVLKKDYLKKFAEFNDVYDLKVNNNVAYAATDKGLIVFDISNPQDTKLLNTPSSLVWRDAISADFDKGVYVNITSQDIQDSLVLTKESSGKYKDEGIYYSQIYDTGGSQYFGKINWVSTLNGGALTVFVKSCREFNCSDKEYWEGCDKNIEKNKSLIQAQCVNDSDRYLQYKIIMSPSDDGTQSPHFDEISIDYYPYYRKLKLNKNSSFLYALKDGKLDFFSLTNPSNPFLEFSLNLDYAGTSLDFDITNNYAYIANVGYKDLINNNSLKKWTQDTNDDFNQGVTQKTIVENNSVHLGVAIPASTIPSLGVNYDYCGGGQNCFLLNNGNVECFGIDSWCVFGMCDNYTGGDAIGIATGWVHNCVLKSNGNTHCWGWTPNIEDYTGGDAVGVAAGGASTCLILKDKSIKCYGDAANYVKYTKNDVFALAIGNYHTCILNSNSNVYCYLLGGNYDYGQAENYLNGDAVGVSAGMKHTCVLLNNGNVHCYGDNTYGQANDYNGGDAIAISSGDNHNCILKEDNTVHCWGDNSYNQSINYTEQAPVPLGVSGGGYQTCIAVDNGNIKCYSNTSPLGDDYTGGDAQIFSVKDLYYLDGSYISTIYNTGINNGYYIIDWEDTLNKGVIQVKVRTCDDANCNGEELPSGAGTKEWDSCDYAKNGQDISLLNCVTDGEEWVQYKVFFTTPNNNYTPYFNKINIRYFSFGLDKDGYIRIVNINSNPPQLESNYLEDSNGFCPNNCEEQSAVVSIDDSVVKNIFFSFADSRNSLRLYRADISDPLSPLIISSKEYNNFNTPKQLDIANNYLLLLGDIDSDDNLIDCQGVACSIKQDKLGDFKRFVQEKTDILSYPGNIILESDENGHYYFQGTSTSPVFDLGNVERFGNIFWEGTLEGGEGVTKIRVKLRSCDDPDCSIDGDVNELIDKNWDSCDYANNGQDISLLNCITNGDRYLQYKIVLDTTDYIATPYLYNLVVQYLRSEKNWLTLFSTDLSSEPLVYQIDQTGAFIEKDNYLYFPQDGKVQVFDMDNPESSVFYYGSFEVGQAVDMFGNGIDQYLIVSSPGALEALKLFTIAPGIKIDQLSGDLSKGRVCKVEGDADYVYVIYDNSAVEVYRADNLKTPLGFLPASSFMPYVDEAVLYGDYLFIFGHDDNGNGYYRKINVSDKNNLIAGPPQNFDRVRFAVVNNNLLYFSLGSEPPLFKGGLKIYYLPDLTEANNYYSINNNYYTHYLAIGDDGKLYQEAWRDEDSDRSLAVYILNSEGLTIQEPEIIPGINPGSMVEKDGYLYTGGDNLKIYTTNNISSNSEINSLIDDLGGGNYNLKLVGSNLLVDREPEREYSNYKFQTQQLAWSQTLDDDFYQGSFLRTSSTDDSVTLDIEEGPITGSQIVVSLNYTCSLSEEGETYCWGYNRDGQLGDNTTTNRSTPVRVLAGQAFSGDKDGLYLANIKNIGAGYSHVCAVSSNTNIYCWGDNYNGQLGDGTTIDRHTPVRVLAGQAAPGDTDGTYLTNIRSVTAGDRYTCAVSNNNNVYCWGYNEYRQLGDGTAINRSTPVRVLAGEAVSGDKNGLYLANVRSVGAVGYTTCAVSNNNNIYCWGHNYSGQLGIGTTNNISSTPVRVLAGEAVSGDRENGYLSNIKNISTGNDGRWGYWINICAVSNNNNIYCWGENGSGQLGDGTTTDRSTPVRVLAGEAVSGDKSENGYLANIRSIEAVGGTTCAVSNNNNIYCWGDNNYNQLGNGEVGSRSIPVRVLAGEATPGDTDGTYLTNVKTVSAGYYHTCAVSNNNNVYCWGRGGEGELGNNNFASDSTPVRVHGVNNIGYLSLSAIIIYYSGGEYLSSIFDTIINQGYSNIFWDQTLPADTSIIVKVRTSDNSNMVGAPDWATCDGLVNNQDLSSNNCVTDGERYVQYYLNLSTNNTSVTPFLNNITINYIRTTGFISNEYYLINDCNDFSSSAIIDIFDPANPYIKKTYEGGMGKIVGDYVYRKREGSYIEILKLFDHGTLLEK